MTHLKFLKGVLASQEIFLLKGYFINIKELNDNSINVLKPNKL